MSDMKYSDTWSKKNRNSPNPSDTGCPVTDLAGIYEEFADDSNKFVGDFVPALEKMLSNGVDFGSSAAAKPIGSKSAVCKRPDANGKSRFWVCYNADNVKKVVTIENDSEAAAKIATSFAPAVKAA